MKGPEFTQEDVAHLKRLAAGYYGDDREVPAIKKVEAMVPPPRTALLSELGSKSDGVVLSEVAAFLLVSAATIQRDHPQRYAMILNVVDRLDRITQRLITEDGF